MRIGKIKIAEKKIFSAKLVTNKLKFYEYIIHIVVKKINTIFLPVDDGVDQAVLLIGSKTSVYSGGVDRRVAENVS